MVGDDTAVKFDFAQGFHHVVHVLVAVVDEGFDPRFGHGIGDIAKVDFEELTFGGKVLDGINDAHAHANRSTFEPAADTQTDADMRAVGDFHGFFVALKIPKHTTGNATQ